jgi:hypothetical protein
LESNWKLADPSTAREEARRIIDEELRNMGVPVPRPENGQRALTLTQQALKEQIYAGGAKF